MNEMKELTTLKRKKNIFIFFFIALLVIFCTVCYIISKLSISANVQLLLIVGIAGTTILLEVLITNTLNKCFKRITILTLPMEYTEVNLWSVSYIPDHIPKFCISTVYAKRGIIKDVDVKFVYTDGTKDVLLSLSLEEAQEFILL